ncbi:D-amino-acid transaminase [Acidisphaera rubrifaciens]|uniref:Probable branched-chain-amino-acid aminotransferase n=1 Tax=Acidisphaera rubrifaciens HS-AP3 TaxID=1231350 RepID=A0A0D6P2M9_9PROT|nr:D-amino-acid transaminase [Acidisphaera rubrifaciens]GAN75922.1 D-amino acid aminotransferase [Acidisphaera rubrifaciens HS-AP3]
MSRIAYVKGRYVAQRHASVSIEDRGLQFADSVYEVVPLLHGRAVDEDGHLGRLDRSLAALGIALPLTRAALRCVLREVAARNRVVNGILYLQVTRGTARREHHFPAAIGDATLIVTARALPPPGDVAAAAVRAITRPDERWARCDIKSTGLLANVLARQAARSAGAYEAILIGRDGIVTEGAATTVWVVDRDGRLRTRHLDASVLAGCTRAMLVAVLARADIAFVEQGVTLDELRAAREVFLTSASSYVKPVIAIDGRPVGDGTPGPLTRQLHALLLREVGAA